MYSCLFPVAFRLLPSYPCPSPWFQLSLLRASKLFFRPPCSICLPVSQSLTLAQSLGLRVAYMSQYALMESGSHYSSRSSVVFSTGSIFIDFSGNLLELSLCTYALHTHNWWLGAYCSYFPILCILLHILNWSLYNSVRLLAASCWTNRTGDIIQIQLCLCFPISLNFILYRWSLHQGNFRVSPLGSGPLP